MSVPAVSGMNLSKSLAWRIISFTWATYEKSCQPGSGGTEMVRAFFINSRAREIRSAVVTNFAMQFSFLQVA
jgi:hypothetical protein